MRLLAPRHYANLIAADVTRVWYLLITSLFIVLVALGITTSSLGISFLRFDPASDSGVMLGEPLAIRSDEWMRNTPLRLGIMHTGDDGYVTPLTEGPGLLTGLQAGPAASLVFLDATIARLGPLIPDRQLFALLWWLPYYGIAIGVAYILRFFRVRPVIAIATAALSGLSPAIAWWSLVAPLNVALAIGSAAFMIAAYQQAMGSKTRWRLARTAISTLASGVLLARMPLAYPPWGIPLGVLVLAPIALALVWKRPRRVGLIVVGTVSLIAILLVADVLFQNQDAYAGFADTAYPGVRRSVGGGVTIAYFLSAHFAGAYLADGLELAGINQSEMATGLTALSIAVLAYAIAYRTRLRNDVRPFVVTAAGALFALSAWVLLPWPAWSARIPILSLLPPMRVAQIAGMGAMLLFAVVLDQIVEPRNRRKSIGFIVTAIVALVMIFVGFTLQASLMPQLTTTTIFMTAAALSLSLAASTHERFYPVGVSALVAMSLVAAGLTSPVMVGLGDLRGREFEAVRSMLSAAMGDGYMAADDMFMNSMTEAAGLKSLSGEQAAPSPEWLVLDPERRYMSAWNRGAIVLFQWEPELSFPAIETPQSDVLIVRSSPCDHRLAALGLTALTSTRPIEAPCLRPVGQFTWGGASRWAYSIGD